MQHPAPRIVAVDLDDPSDQVVWLRLLEGYARSREGGGAGLVPDVAHSLPDRLSAWPGFYSWIAWVGREAAGVINCFTGFSTFAGRAVLNIHDLYTEPSHRGRGVARALLARAEAEARLLGYCKLTLEVLEHNGAQRLYTHFGFAPYKLDPALGRALFLEKPLLPDADALR